MSSQRPPLVTRDFVRVTVTSFVYFLAYGTTLPVLPRYVKGPLHGTSFEVGLAVGSFAFAAVILRPVAGRLGDRIGRVFLMITGAALVGVSFAGFNVATSLWLLVLLRLGTGAGEAFFFVGAASAINDLAPDERRGEAVSFFSLALYGGLAVGPVLGETVLRDTRFGAVWWMAGGLSVLAALMSLRVRETRPRERAEHATRLLHPAAVLPGVALTTSVWGLATFNTFVPLYALALGMRGSRFVFLVYSIVIIAVRALGARIPDRLGPVRAARVSLATSACGLLVMWAWGHPAGLYAATIVWALGQALAFPALMTIAVSAASPGERGAVVGTFTAFLDLSFGLGALSVGGVASVLGYRGAFATSGLVAIAGLALLALRTRRSAARAPA
jgi:MFS family permease